ncbi:MAG: ABC transporter ATP-binding protein [Bacteroidales bacterium]
MDEILIDVQGVSKRFCKDLKRSMRYGFMDSLRAIAGQDATAAKLRKDEFWAVKDVSFQLRRGECLGLIGHNGAGKSTLLKMLNGLINPDQGSITIRGKIGALIELGAGFNPILTGRENIYNNGAVLGFSRKEIDAKVEAIIDFAEIREFIDAPVQNYSSGMRVRLGFAVAAQMEPDVLLIDEVLAVGDMGFIIKCLNRISEMMPNCAMIFVTHSMPMMARVCTQVMLMDKGGVDYYSSDITVGITKYISMFEAPESSNQGSGEVEVNAIAIKNPITECYENSNNLLLKTYDDLEIKVSLKLKETVGEYYIGITAFDGQLREVLSSGSRYADTKFENNGVSLKYFTIKIPRIILASGKYSITFVASDPITLKFYCRMTNAISFTMEAIGQTWATSIVEGEWKEISN